MAYQVLARRWRPRTFAEVVGQPHVTRTLGSALERDRVGHAFLFTGVRGVGKTTVARLLARALNCSERKGAEPCNQCPPCTQALADASVDVLEIDGASNNSVDDVRAIIEASAYRPAGSRYRVYIIDEVHQLSKGAFNALLKLLEEPPDHVRFIMATTEIQKMPATVLSRCQRFDFRRISMTDLVGHLAHVAEVDKLGVGLDAIELLSREADGSMRDAQSLLEQVVASGEEKMDAAFVSDFLGIAGRDSVAAVVEGILDADCARVVELAALCRDRGYDTSNLLLRVMELLRYVTIAASAGVEAVPRGAGDDYRQLAERLADRRSTLDLHRVFQCLLKTASQLRGSESPELVLEMGLLQVASLEPVAMAAELLEGLRGGAEIPPPAAQGKPQSSKAVAPKATTRKAASPKDPAPEEAPPPLGTPVAQEAAGQEAPGTESAAPAAEGSYGERWEGFLASVQNKAGIDLYVLLTNCEVLQLDAHKLTIKPQLSGYLRRLEEKELRGRVLDLAREHFGAELELEVLGLNSSRVADSFSVKTLEAGRDSETEAQAR
ncbi:MAG: DNA polymerase III subunit gamma/tau, partial [Deltaproteobacteria bacterium]|nr:DNA polymerase III subunit gamma/tau [Deltaproteobacteria bacterium]